MSSGPLIDYEAVVEAGEKKLREAREGSEDAVLRQPFLDYEAILRRGEARRSAIFRQVLRQASRHDPDREAEVQRLHRETGLSPDLVRRQLDQVRRVAGRAYVLPAEEIVRDAPVVARWMGREQGNAILAQDDARNLKGLEWWWKAPREAWREGWQIIEMGRLGWKQMAGTITPAEEQRLLQLEQQNTGGRWHGEEGFLSSAVIEAARMAPTSVGALKEGASGGMKGAIIGGGLALLAGQAGPQAAIPEEIATVPAAALAGWFVGSLYGAARFSMELEGGLAYREFLQDGIDPGVARVAALGVGFINAGLEMVGLHSILSTFPGGKKILQALSRKSIRRLLARPTARKALFNLAKRYGTAIAGETGTEVAQEAVTIFAGEVAKSLSPGDLRHMTAEEIAQRLADTFAQTAKAMTIMGAAGPVTHLATDLYEVRRAEVQKERLAALGDITRASKLRERLPEKLRELAQEIHEEARPVEDIYISVDRWDAYWKSRGADPAEVAEEVLGSPDPYQEARQARADLVIPLPRYVEKLAGTEHHEGLSEDLRLYQDGLSLREARELQGRTEERIRELAAGQALPEDGPVRVLYEEIQKELAEKIEADPTVIDAYATLWANTIANLAQRMGLSPRELWGRYRVEVDAAGRPVAMRVDPLHVPPGSGARTPGARVAPVSREALPATATGEPAAVETWAFSTVDPDKAYDLEYAIVSLDDLVTSHDTEGNPVEEYPEELQQWDRSSTASREQVQAIGASSSFRNLLTEQHALDRGAPIVGEDMAVESGNGRTLGLRLARQRNSEAWQDYQQRLREIAGRLGLDVEGIKDPVLVRRRRFQLTPAERVEFTRDANARASREPSPVERAKLDAERITTEMLAATPMSEGNTIEQALVTKEGGDWVGKFLAGLPEEEHSRFMDQDGRVGLHGINAIRLALFIRTFGDEYGERVLRTFLEMQGAGRRNLEQALFRALPRLARLKGRIEAGLVDPEYDITGDIAAAIEVYQRIRSEGMLVSDYLQQQAMFGRELDPFQEALLQAVDANARRGARLGALLDAYANAALKQPPPGQASFGFEEARPPTKQQLWESAFRKQQEEDAAAAAQTTLFQGEEEGAAALPDDLAEEHPEEAVARIRQAIGAEHESDVAAWERLSPEQRRALLRTYRKALQYRPHLEATLDALAWAVGGRVVMGPIKTIGRIVEKIEDDPKYDGDPAAVMDILRGTVVVDSVGSAMTVGEIAREHLRIPEGRFKDRITNPTLAGYRDLMFNVAAPDGFVAEIQVLHQAMLDAKFGPGHELYEAEQRARAAGDYEEAERLRQAQIELYGEAWRVWEASRARFSSMEAWTRFRQSASEMGTPSRNALAYTRAWFSGRKSSPPQAEKTSPSGVTTQGENSTSRNWVPSGNLSGIGRRSDMGAPSKKKVTPGEGQDKGNGPREGESGPVELDQTAFHGTPHEVGRFSLEAVGTGEGVQAYGWGLYFAEAPETARYYRDKLAPRDIRVGAVPLSGIWRSAPVEEQPFWRRVVEAAEKVLDAEGDAREGALEEYRGILREALESGTDPVTGEALSQFGLRYVRQALDAATSVEVFQDTSRGRVYEVDLRAEDEEWLDWDRPLAQQSEAVRASLALLGELYRSTEGERGVYIHGTGEQIYRELVWAIRRYREEGNLDSDHLPMLRPGMIGATDEETASRYLAGLGIAGIRYLDQLSRIRGEGTHNFVLFDDSRVEITRVLAQEGEGPGRRGFIRFQPRGRRFEIHLLEKADLSTFLHETGHMFLEILGDLAEEEGAPEQIREDYRTILRWLGVESRDQITREHHEAWARAFEAYLREGRAPAPELRTAFARFRAWLVAIYRTLTGLRVELSDEVRGVMDRLVATDDQIRAAEQELGLATLWPDAASAGMTEEEFARYRKAVERARILAEEEVLRELVAEQRRELEAWWREEKRRVEAEIRAELAADPAYRALYWLQFGRTIDGSESELEPMKLSREALVEMYGEEILKQLPRPYVYRREGGVHPDVAAEALGFSSGDELVQALLRIRRSVGQTVREETERRMLERHGDLLHQPGRLAEVAREALHGDARARVLMTELRVLARRLDGRVLSLQALRDTARELIGRRQAGDLRPHVYLRAEQKAAREAFEAAARQDWEAAHEAKQRQLLNHMLWREAINARKEVEKAVRYLHRMTKDPARRRLGQAGEEYLDQVDQLLERFDFRQVSQKEARRRQRLAEWIREREEEGRDVVISEKLRDEAFRKPWRLLTVEELRELRDAVKNIEHLARLKNQLVTEAGAREWQEVKLELIGTARANLPQKWRQTIDPATRTAFERLRRKLNEADATLLKIEQIIEWLDGGRKDGAWSRYVWNPIADAQVAEDDMTVEVLQRLVEAFERLPARQRRRLVSEERYIPSIRESLTFQAILAVALNVGNESNKKKLLQGYGWTEKQLDDILRHLTKEDWDFVQEIWDILDSLWPRIEALEKRLTGIAPPRVEPSPVKTPYGTYRGGYYPVIYDRRKTWVGQLQVERMTHVLFEHGYSRAATPHGHTIRRQENFAAPILLSLDVLPRHISQVIHDLTHREAVLSVYRILRDPDVRSALYEALGEAYADAMMDWLRNVANDAATRNARMDDFWSSFLDSTRAHVAIVAMGFKASVMLAQLAGLSSSLELVRSRYLMRGVRELLRNPKRAYEKVTTLSGEMRHRTGNLDRDVRAALKKLLGRKGPLDAARRFAFHGIAYADMAVSIPTWLGAYYQAIDEGLGHDDAVRAADRAVRLSQGAAGAKDLARIQQRNELFRLLTMFYSYFSALYSRTRTLGKDTKESLVEGKISNFPHLLARWFFLWAIPSVINELLAGRGPDEDDDEGWARWIAKKVLVYPFLTLPFVRDIASALESGYRYRWSPIVSAFEQMYQAAKTTGRWLTGDADFHDVSREALETSGYLFGLPTAQARITLGYLWDVFTGAEHPESLREFVRNLLFRRKKKGRK